ncbi:MAG: type II toxin-antitoxin system VapB family antitoxin [Bacteroidota bacterium]
MTIGLEIRITILSRSDLFYSAASVRKLRSYCRYIQKFFLYHKLSDLPSNIKSEVSDFIDFLKYKKTKGSLHKEKREAGKAKGLIEIKNNFDDSIEGFQNYI